MRFNILKFTAGCFTFVSVLILTRKVIHLNGVHHKKSDLEFAVMSRASDSYIILAIVDDSVSDMAFNLYETSLRKHNINNFLFVGLGSQSCEHFVAAALPCFRSMDLNASGSPSVYNSRQFLQKMHIRNQIILKTLRVGYTVILTDLDIVFLRNPLPHIKVSSRFVLSLCVETCLHRRQLLWG